MKKYTLSFIYFCIPVLICCFSLIIFDPHNFFNITKIIDDTSKLKIINRTYESQTRGNMLWKACRYNREPKTKVIIGDSQGYHIKEKLIKEQNGEEYFNYCIPGANPETKFSIFWDIVTKTKLEKVIFQVTFSPQISPFPYNLFHFAEDYIKNPALYFFSKDNMCDCFNDLKFLISKKCIVERNDLFFPRTLEKDKMFDSMLNRIFTNYSYPKDYFNELRKISSYCKEHNVQLEFIIFPYHQRFSDFLEENKFISQRDQFREEIKSIGKTYDFSDENNISLYDRNFVDYIHPNQHITDSLTTMIWKHN